MKRLHVIAAIPVLFLGCQAWAQSSAPSAPPQEKACPTEIGALGHGMVLFGTDRLYASHIPMFHGEEATPAEMFHCWQAFFEVELSHPEKDAKAVYLENAVEDGKQRLMTLAPEPFVLPELLGGKISSFETALYDGNFEDAKQGRELLSGVSVKIAGATHKPLSRQSPGLDSLTYLSIGHGRDGDAYLAHKISAPDNFDHIVQIKWSGEVRGGLAQEIVFRAGGAAVADTIENRLKPGQVFEVAISRLGLAATPAGSSEAKFPGAATFTVVGDFYCLVGPGFGAGDHCP